MSAAPPSLLPQSRRRAVLEDALGPHVAAALRAPDVTEALINADGRLWIDRAGAGLAPTDVILPVSDREAAIRLIAHEAGETVGPDRPFLSAVLPGSAARVQAVLPPLVSAPILAIRKRPPRIFTLDDYVASGAATEAQAEELRAAIARRRNIIGLRRELRPAPDQAHRAAGHFARPCPDGAAPPAGPDHCRRSARWRGA